MTSPQFFLAVSMILVAGLAGCGKGAAPKKGEAAAPTEYGVFISTADCAELGKLSEEICGKVIDMAVKSHQKDAPIYKFLQKCEAAEGGPERCDKTGEDEYRPRLQAFYVTFATLPSATGLYPPKTAKVGFRTLANAAIDAKDASLHISNEAMTVANENGKLRQK
jgi:uncharacterized protein YgiB involved in biofilm formation